MIIIFIFNIDSICCFERIDNNEDKYSYLTMQYYDYKYINTIKINYLFVPIEFFACH